jgi:streptogramin lyase
MNGKGNNNRVLPKRLPMASTIFSLVLAFCLQASAQQSVRGSIKGTVTADQGEVRAFRVSAHNLDRRLWYTVFTNKGAYTVPQALPGRYEVMVYEPGYDSPKSPVQLGPGETKTADLAVKKRAQAQAQNTIGGGGDEGVPQGRSSGKFVYVNSLDEIYPAGPARDLLKEQCIGCHDDGFSSMHYTKERYMRGIERMTETGPSNEQYALALGRTVIDAKQKEMLADYLFKNFGPGMPEKKLKVDPLFLDEDVASKAIYVSYDLPEDLGMQPTQNNVVNAPMVDGVIPQYPGLKVHHLQQAAISPLDGSVWFSSRVSNSVIRLDPKQQDPVKRWMNYPIKGDNWVGVSGMAVDSKGRVYWSELKGGMLGELDPVTGKQIRHQLPAQGSDIAVVVDKNDNVAFAFSWGSLFGRMDATTRQIHMYATPIPDNGIYGLAVDQNGNLWGAGWTKGNINAWDAETQAVKVYDVPNSWGQVRRIGVDSKGIVWGSEYNTGLMARLDPTTGKLTEYKIPVSGANPYDAWPDKSDNIWTCDETHSVMIKLDQKNGKFTFYPMPQPKQSVPKIDVEANNTIWFGTRGEPIITGVHFYPNGYTADAPPLP